MSFTPRGGEDEITGFFLDQTDIHRAHETIQRNEKLLRNIFDNIQVGVELYTPDGKLVDINNKDMEIFGVTKEEALGLNFYENPLVPQEIRDGVREGREQAFRLNYPFDRLDGYYTSGKPGSWRYTPRSTCSTTRRDCWLTSC